MDVRVPSLTVRLTIIYCDWKRNAAWQRAENLEEAAQCPLIQMSTCKLNLVKISRAFWGNTQKSRCICNLPYWKSCFQEEVWVMLKHTSLFCKYILLLQKSRCYSSVLLFFFHLLLMIAMSISIWYIDIYVCYLFSPHTVFPKESLRLEPGNSVWCISIQGSLSHEYKSWMEAKLHWLHKVYNKP